MEALGPPETVAASAAETLQAHSWSARHPYLFTLSFGLGALIFNVTVLVAIAVVSGGRLGSQDQWLACLGAEAAVGALNWLTPIAGGWLLIGISRRYPIGWKTLFSTSIGLALAVSMVGVWYIPHFAPGYGPADHHISLILVDSPILYFFLASKGRAHLYSGSSFYFHGMYQNLLYLGHLLLPIVAVFGCRYVIVARTMNPRSSVPPGAIS